MLLVLILATACDKDKETEIDCNALEAQFEVTIEEWATALLDYAFVESSANCSAYKTATQHFLAEAKASRSCVDSADLEEFDTSIAETEAELANLDC